MPLSRLQQVPRAAYQQVVHAGQQCRRARVSGPIRTGELAAATLSARWSQLGSQFGCVRGGS